MTFYVFSPFLHTLATVNSISWRYRETCVEIETKYFGDFLVLVLFSSPLPLLLNFVRLETFQVFFAVVLTRHRQERKKGKGARVAEEEERDEEGVVMTLIVTTDPNKCTHLEDYRKYKDR